MLESSLSNNMFSYRAGCKSLRWSSWINTKQQYAFAFVPLLDFFWKWSWPTFLFINACGLRNVILVYDKSNVFQSN